jgi:glycerate 2-kinase
VISHADLKQLARRIFHETLAAIDIPLTMQRKLLREGSLLRCGAVAIDLSRFKKIRVVAIGKAAHAMLDGLRASLPRDLSFAGIASAPVSPANAYSGIQYFIGGHPIPNEDSWNAAKAILEMLSACDDQTLVFFLLSGGSSALVELPLNLQLNLTDMQQIHRVLVGCGAPIEAINTVRKHISAVKGGRLVTAANRATKITLAVSDVPAGKEWALASGPTLPDPTTLSDMDKILDEYALRDEFPDAFHRWVTQGALPETPKADDAAFTNAHFSILLGLDNLFHPAHGASEASGCISCCDNATDDWPVERATEYLLAQLEELHSNNPARRVAVIADGEVSSPIRGKGIGGRNAAFVLSCVEKIAGKKIAVLSAGTDGIDGNSPAAGAVADGETLARALAVGLDPRDAFERSDAYTFFDRLGDAIITGPTGNNLRDLRILIAAPDAESYSGKFRLPNSGLQGLD